MPSRSFDQKTAKGFIRNSFLRFGRREFQWMVLQDVFQKYSCMGHLLEKKEDDDLDDLNDSDQGYLLRGIDNETVILNLFTFVLFSID